MEAARPGEPQRYPHMRRWLRSARQPNARGHVRGVALGHQLALANQRGDTRLQHEVTDLEKGFGVVANRIVNDASDLLPFDGRLFQKRRVEVVDRRRGQTGFRDDAERSVVAPQPSPRFPALLLLLSRDRLLRSKQRL